MVSFHRVHHKLVSKKMDPLYPSCRLVKPKFSPASTAGLDKIILSISLFFNIATAFATAKKDLPVPAGPISKTKSNSSIAFKYLI